MPQSNFSEILLYKSDTAGAVPAALSLVNTSAGAEIAVNTADKRVFVKNALGTVVELGTNPSSLTLPNATPNGIAFVNGSKVVTTGSALTFDGTNLGIGTAVPYGGVYATIHAFAAGGSSLRLDRTGAGTSTIQSIETGVAYRDLTLDAANNIFSISGTETMRLTSTGLGIGTSSPAAKLGVNGNAIFSGGVGGSPFIAFSQDQGGGTPAYWQWSSSTGLCTFYATNSSSANGSFKWMTSGADRMFLDSSGNLGLGVTPSAWHSSFTAFQVSTGSFAANAGEIDVSHNAYFDGTNWRYIGSGFATNHYQVSGAYVWRTAPPWSGTGSDVIPFTQAMTLDALGNLVVGHTSGTYRVTASRASGGSQVAITSATAAGTNAAPLNLDLDFLGYADIPKARIRAVDTSSNTAGSHLAFFTNNDSGSFTERARITSGGNLLVGTTTDGGYKTVIDSGASTQTLELRAGSLTGSRIQMGLGVITAGRPFIGGSSVSNPIEIGTQASSEVIFVQAATERARITSGGNLSVGFTSALYQGKIGAEGVGSNNAIYTSNTTAASGSRYHFAFYESGVERGSITSNGSTTSYNTSSDYRLKEITGPITTSGAYIDSLNPVEGTWKADGSTFVGLIAHEAQEASRTPVATGTKDGEQMQAMDYSAPEIIANMIAELKSLRARVAQLETQGT